MIYHGWRIAWALAVTQTVGYGVLYYTFSVLVLPMEQELGLSRAQTAGAFSLALLMSGLTAVPVGRWVDARGARLLMSVGSALGVGLTLLWSTVDSLLALYLVQAGIGLVMSAVFYEVAFTVIAVWFRRNRMAAMLLVTTVAGLASTVFIPLASYLEVMFGWRVALRLLALVLATTTIPLHALVLRRHPRSLGLEADGAPRVSTVTDSTVESEPTVTTREALRAPTFWWLSAAFALDRIVIIAIAAHSVPLLLERGYPPALVAAAAGSIGLMQVAGRLLFTPASGRAPLTLLTALTFGLHALSLIALLLLPSAFGVWLFAGLFGMANGASTLARAGLVAQIYGAAHYGSINGSMATLIALLQTVAPLGAGALHDLAGSYDPVLWSLVGVALLAAAAIGRVEVARPHYAD